MAAFNRRNNAQTEYLTKSVALKAFGAALFVSSLPLVLVAICTGSFAALTFGAVLLVASHDSLVVGHNMAHPGWSEGKQLAASLWEHYWNPSEDRTQSNARYWNLFSTETIVVRQVLQCFV